MALPSLTAAIKDELATTPLAHPAARAAQVGAILRFAGELRLGPGHSVVAAELDRLSVAERLRDDIIALYGYAAQLDRHQPTTARAERHSVRVTTHAVDLARQSGLIDRRGRRVRGLPARLVGGTTADAQALWRGAVMVAGTVSDPRRCTLTVSCPSLESALALAGAARRFDIAAKTRDGHAGHQVIVRDGDTVSVLLHRLGAPKGQAAFDEQRRRAHVRRTKQQLVNFDTANQQRAQISAAITAARVSRAFEILGDSVPDHLAEFGRLRLAHPQATLDELGRLADPPVTKDTASGRLRRLLSTADQRAKATGMPDTAAAVPDDLREQL